MATIVLTLGLALPVIAGLLFGSGIRVVRIEGNRAIAEVGLLGIVGTELILEFESVKGLTASNLGISAELVNPLSPAFRARLPDGSGLLTVALPVQFVVEPPRYGGLSFTNTVRAEIHTHMLGFTIDSPLRLYKSPHGGGFFDVTNAVTDGSVRTSGRTGGFSDFIVLLDLLPSSEHSDDKFEYLDLRLDNPAISPTARALLESDLAAARSAFAAGNHAGAITKMDKFIADVRSHAGTGVPNLWRSARDRDNIAGDLIGNAESLKFSIDRNSRSR